MAKKRIRIKDIALAAGVSTGTVDRVLHNRGSVTSKVRQKVEAVMKELNYRPNVMASALANNKVLKIAVLLPDFKEDAFWAAPKNGIDRASKANQHFLMDIQYYFFKETEVASFVSQSAKIAKDLPDALIIAPIFAKEASDFLALISEKKIPFVLINTHLKIASNLCYIGQDSFQSGVLGARLLFTHHKEKATFLILHLEEEERAENAAHLIQKELGFISFMEQYAPDCTLLKKAFSDERENISVDVFLHSILEEYPRLSGIFLSTSKAYQLIAILGEKLEGITIVGHDLLPQNIDYLKKGKIDYLINQNPERQGFLALSSIVEHLLLKKEVASVQYLPLDIVVRENVAYYSNLYVDY